MTATEPNLKEDFFGLNEPVVPKFDEQKNKDMGFDTQTEGLSFIQRRQKQTHSGWDKYWEIRDNESKETYYARLNYLAHYYFDRPVTFFRQKITEPLNNRYRLPYYHRRLDRVPEIDQCGVEDRVCFYEANEQYRFDKMVDAHILVILKYRASRCLDYWGFSHVYKCTKYIEDFEQNDLNFFIKYGEMGHTKDVKDAYMKQKHRLIWERRHPEVMAERKRMEQEHRKAMEEGKYDLRFWTKFSLFQNKQNLLPANIYGPGWSADKFPFEADQPISRDWRYYKKLSEDVEFDRRNYPKWLNEAAKKAREWEEEHRRMEEVDKEQQEPE